MLQENGIQVRAICGVVNDDHALALFGLNRIWPSAQPVLVVLAVHALFVLAGVVFVALKLRGPGAAGVTDKAS